MTTKHPSRHSLTITTSFKGRVSSGVTSTARPRGLCTISIHGVQHPHRPFFPLFHFLQGIVTLHGDKIPLPHAP